MEDGMMILIVEPWMTLLVFRVCLAVDGLDPPTLM